MISKYHDIGQIYETLKEMIKMTTRGLLGTQYGRKETYKRLGKEKSERDC